MSGSENINIREIAKHLRTVHFAILLVCLVLIGSLFTKDRGALGIAQRDLSAIRRLTLLAHDKRDVSAELESRVAQSSPEQLNLPLNDSIIHVYLDVNWGDSKALYELQYKKFAFFCVDEAGRTTTIRPSIPKFNISTLSDFRDYYDIV